MLTSIDEEQNKIFRISLDMLLLVEEITSNSTNLSKEPHDKMGK